MLKKSIITVVCLLGITLPSFSAITEERAIELAKSKGIEIKVEKDNHNINAYANYSDEITFLQGLLDAPKLTESEFLTVLYHEKAHVKFRHVHQRVELATLLDSAYDIIFSEAKVSPEVAQQILTSLKLILDAQSRVEEIEADNDSFKVLKEEGVGIEACDLFIDIIPDNKGAVFTPFDTHPSTKSRYESCRAILGGETK
jgi:Zn-dependent protease with chaperone function